MKWGIGSLLSIVGSAIMYMVYQTQSADVFAAGADASSFDINLANGAGLGAATTLIGGLWMSWKSGSPQRIIRSLGLLAVWSTSLGNKEIADHVNAIAVIAAKENTTTRLPATVGDLVQQIKDQVAEQLRTLLPPEAPKS